MANFCPLNGIPMFSEDEIKSIKETLCLAFVDEIDIRKYGCGELSIYTPFIYRHDDSHRFSLELLKNGKVRITDRGSFLDGVDRYNSFLNHPSISPVLSEAKIEQKEGSYRRNTLFIDTSRDQLTENLFKFAKNLIRLAEIAKKL